MKKRKILLVTGEETIQTLLTNLLKSDYECISVQKSESVPAYLDENAGGIDLIIIDLQKPATDDFKILQWIEDNPLHKNIPTLILIATDQMEEIKYAFSIGVDDVIIKPLNPDIFINRISNMLYIGKNRSIHNVMEDLIWEAIDEYINTLGICSCTVCRRDLLTMTLNKVPPRYVTTEKGKTIAKAESQTSRNEKIKLLTELAYCAQMVKQKPRHKSS